MRILPYFVFLALFCFSCNKKNTADRKRESDNYKSSKYSFQKIEYKKQAELFDSTFIMKGNKVRLSCYTECFTDFSIADTINDSIINLYQDRFIKFELKSNQLDTQIVVTKEIIKDIYNNNSTYKRSVLAFPRIEKISSSTNSVLIHAMFLYPGSLDATNFLEEIIFEITAKGNVSFNKVILPPEEPSGLNTNSPEAVVR